MADDSIQSFADLDVLASHLREQMEQKKYCLLFAYNGTGKTRLSTVFKELGKGTITSPVTSGGEPVTSEGEAVVITETTRDTLYFNAFTEDLFTWDNDLENDAERVLRMNTASRFFNGLAELEMENRIRPFLHRYGDFDFEIDYEQGTISFSLDKRVETVPGRWETETLDAIKISRGEENIFVWCFFLAIAQLATEGQEAYDWVKYIYIDDPISSLDDNNAIAVAAQLARLLKEQDRIKVVLSSHHTLFFNVMCNELKKAQRYFLSKTVGGYELRNTKDTPQFYHVAMLKELHEAAESGKLYTYHFNILRGIIEKAATFHGFNHVGDLIKKDPDDEDGALHFRYIQLLSHGNYSLFEPVEMLDENKDIFRKILHSFMIDYRFNPELFPEADDEEITA